MELTRITGVAELVPRNINDPDPIVRLTARGTSAAVERLGKLLAERLDAFADLQQELMQVPKFALGILFQTDRQTGTAEGSLAYQLEAQSGALITIQGPHDKALKTSHLSIRGSASQIEHAKELIQERISKKGGKGGMESHGGKGYR